MLITLGGKSGSGKGTLAKKLQDKLGYEIVSIGNIKRELASQMGMTIFEFDQEGDKPENREKFDLKYEEYQKSLNLSDDIILESRLGFFCQSDAFKIFLDVSDEESARRIFEAQRSDDANVSYEEVLRVTKERNARHIRTYKTLYHIQNLFSPEHYDLVIDTTNITVQELADQVFDALQKVGIH